MIRAPAFRSLSHTTPTPENADLLNRKRVGTRAERDDPDTLTPNPRPSTMVAASVKLAWGHNYASIRIHTVGYL